MGTVPEWGLSPFFIPLLAANSAMNYQYLHYSFFTTCRKRKINKTPMLLLIYLRGLYSRFGNIFTWKDKVIINDLGINRRMLQRSRLILQERGVIDFVPGIGHAPTEYLILDTVLAPERVDKRKPRVDKMTRGSGHNVHSLCKSYEDSKEKSNFERFKGISAQDIDFLKTKGVF